MQLACLFLESGLCPGFLGDMGLFIVLSSAGPLYLLFEVKNACD